jgi:type II secretory ATPase GspE/PulE/Tfp pilus assembly ATPase PilB-like protein
MNSALKTKVPTMIQDFNPKVSQQNISHDVPNYVQHLFKICESERASDLHLEPAEKNYRIRLRIDGQLKFFTEIPIPFAQGILHHLKILSHNNIAENRRPQDGRISVLELSESKNLLENKDKNIIKNIRLSFCPTLWGEKCVLRFLQIGLKTPELKDLGFLPEQLQTLYSALNKPQGLILVTGPTGSGKSLTLYSMLSYLNKIEKNIMTIEDPIEIPLPGITQTQINLEIGLDFSDILRSLLRQDPNILMIGEIRDEKTAKMALKAAQTGHLVLATLHANSALESLPRLENLGIDRLSLISSISLLMAQRLVRKIPQGRCAIFELVPIDLNIQELYISFKPLPPPKTSLRDHGLSLIQDNLTSEAEINRVCI